MEEHGAWRTMIFSINGVERGLRVRSLRNRWNIKVFLKLVKQSLRLGSYLDPSTDVVRLQVYMALPVYVLLRFIAHLSKWRHDFT